MGVTEGKWRLKALIVMFLVIFFLYSAQAMFMNIDNPETYMMGDQDYITDRDIGSNLTEEEMREKQSQGMDFFSIMGSFADFLTFGAGGNMPFYARLPLTLLTAIMGIVIGYILYTVIYEIIKGLPFT